MRHKRRSSASRERPDLRPGGSPRAATSEELARVHSPKFLEWMNTSGRGRPYRRRYLPGTAEHRRRGARRGRHGGPGRRPLDGPVKRGIARPPAWASRAARIAGDGVLPLQQRRHRGRPCLRRGLSRVAIIDWDAPRQRHPGDVLRRPERPYVSTHQFLFYPGTGAGARRRARATEGASPERPAHRGRRRRDLPWRLRARSRPHPRNSNRAGARHHQRG